MATYTDTEGRYTLTLTVTQGTQSIANNSSVVNWNLKLVSNGGTLYHWNNTCPWNVKLNGTQVDSGTYSYDLRDGGTQTIFEKSGSTTITHDSDGTKSISVYAYTDMDNSAYVSPLEITGETFTLTTIPRTADLSLSTTSLKITSASGTITANITSKSTAIYNKLTWSGVLSGNAQIGNATTSRSFNVTDILNAMPSSTSGTLTVRVDSYNNANYSGTPIGSNTVSCAITIDTTQIKPSFTANGSIGVNSSPISGYAVAGYSKLAVTGFSVTAGYGATALTITSTISTGSMADTRKTGTSPMTSQSMVSNVLPSSASNYSVKIYILVTDGRGASVQKEYSWTTVYGYTKPTASLRAYRVNSASSTTEDGAGGYVYIATLTSNVGASINGQNTIQTATTSQSGMSGASTFAQGDHRTLAITSSATLTYTVTDKVGGSTTAQVIVGNATYPLILRDNKSGVVGAGFGTFPEAGKVQSALPIQAGISSQSSLPTAGYWIHDTRSVELTAATGDKQANFFFLMTGGGNTMPSSGWWSLLHMRGWTGAYSSWELAGPADNVDSRTIPLYVRGSNKNGDWGSWRQIYDSSNPPTSVTNATNATNVYTTDTNPTSATWYRVAFHNNGGNANVGIRGQDGFLYYTLQGTASALGESLLRLGNNTASGTAGNKRGRVRLYAQNAYYVDLLASNTPSASRTQYLPDKNGTLAIADSTLWTGTLQGSKTQSITTMANYSRIRVYALTWGVQHIFEIDLSDAGKALSGHGLTDSSYPFQGGSTVVHRDGAGTTGGSLMYYSVSCKVSSDKKTLWVTSIGYSSLGTSFNAFAARNSNSEYYVYRVDGIL